MYYQWVVTDWSTSLLPKTAMTSESLPSAFLPLSPALTKYINSGSAVDPMQR